MSSSPAPESALKPTLGVFDVVPEGIRVVELAEGVTREFAQSKTGVPLL